jgi:hypothetical protein
VYVIAFSPGQWSLNAPKAIAEFAETSFSAARLAKQRQLTCGPIGEEYLMLMSRHTGNDLTCFAVFISALLLSAEQGHLEAGPAGGGPSASSAPGLGRVKTKSDLVVMPSERQIFAFFALRMTVEPEIPGAVIPPSNDSRFAQPKPYSSR